MLSKPVAWRLLIWWSPEAHLRLYFEFLERAAQKKFGHVPWARRSRPECPVGL